MECNGWVPGHWPARTSSRWGLGKLVAVLAVAALVLRALMAIAWWQPERFSKLVQQHDGSEIGVRAALLLAVAFSTLAVLAGVESILGALLTKQQRGGEERRETNGFAHRYACPRGLTSIT